MNELSEPATPAPPTAALRRRLPVAVGLGAAALLLLGGFSLWRREPAQVQVPSALAGEVRTEAVGTATIESEHVIHLGFTSGGRVLSVLVVEGDRVQAGDVLARLDVDELELQHRASLVAREKASAGLALRIAELAQADSRLELARSGLVRIEALHRSGAYSTANLDEAKAQRDQSEANRRAVAAGVAQARAEILSAKESAELLAYRIAQGALIAPVDGIVTKRLHEPGGVANPGQTVIELAALQRIWASAWIDETALGALQLGAPARVVLRSAPDHSLQGRVARIAPEIDRETHELLVDVELLELPAPLVFGQRADVFITLQERQRAALQ